MERPKGTVSVTFAIGGNFIIAVFKLFGFIVSNSPSLFSEAVHSFADTANQSLLLLGLKRSRKKADEEFSYGYGNERFLWALISACGIFFVGAGITIYHGINALRYPQITETGPVVFLILGAAFVIESFTLYKAATELRSHNKEASFRDALIDGDPVTIAVVYEDSVAVLGVLVALIGIALAEITGNGAWDAAASIVIGVCLAAIAILLIDKNRAFLIGKSIPPDVKEHIIEMLVAEPYIEKVIDFKSTVLDVGHYHVKCEVEWNGAALLKQLTKDENLKETYKEASASYTEFKRHLAYTANRIPRLMGRTIDEIEKKIVVAIPEVDHIDIEIN